MDLQNLRPKTNASSQSHIQEAELKILKSKIQIMQIVCATFYNTDHRCLLSYISSLTLEGQIIREEEVSDFHNYSSLLIDLKEGYFVSTYQIYQKKQTKKDKRVTCYKLNTTNFFKIIRKILTQLQNKIEKIKKFYLETRSKQSTQPLQQKKIMNKRCKNCHTVQDDHARMFGFDSCLVCRHTQFEIVVIVEDEKVRIQKLTSIISIIFTKLKLIEDMQSKLSNKIEEIKETQKDLKVKQIDRFMDPYQRFLKEKGQKVELLIDFQTIKAAEKIHAPMVQYQKVKQMKNSLQNRYKNQGQTTLLQDNYKVKSL